MLNNVIVRLVLHYVATFIFLIGLWELFPDISIYVAEEQARSRATTLSPQQLEMDPRLALEESSVFHPKTFVPVSMSLLFSFLFALPVTWVYRWTRPRKKYDQAFAHTLLVVPIAIALVVFLVKGSLALAFSLAGIVAAVRFRTSLDDPMDATYMFIVIGIGLSAGVQLGSVAILASVAFNAVALGIWRMNYGAKPATLSGFRLVHPAKEQSLPAPVKARKATARLRVHTAQVEAARQAVTAFLATYAKQWQQVGIVQPEDGPAIIEFDVRLKKSTDPTAFVRQLEESSASHISTVELKSEHAGQ